ncbi:MAG: hypothetical protein ACK4NA_14445 [Alphaproteobacteria bacterium]
MAARIPIDFEFLYEFQAFALFAQFLCRRVESQESVAPNPAEAALSTNLSTGFVDSFHPRDRAACVKEFLRHFSCVTSTDGAQSQALSRLALLRARQDGAHDALDVLPPYAEIDNV